MAQHNEIGKIGEDVAEKYLKKNGFEIIERNYRKPYGEIDIVARKKDRLHFVEVKTVSYPPAGRAGETRYRPEENLTSSKLKRLSRVFQVYLVSHGTEEWQFDVICVYLDPIGKRAKVRMISDIIIGT